MLKYLTSPTLNSPLFTSKDDSRFAVLVMEILSTTIFMSSLNFLKNRETTSASIILVVTSNRPYILFQLPLWEGPGIVPISISVALVPETILRDIVGQTKSFPFCPSPHNRPILQSYTLLLPFRSRIMALTVKISPSTRQSLSKF